MATRSRLARSGYRALLLLGGLLVGVSGAELLARAAGVAPELIAIEVGRYRLSRNLLIGYEPVGGARPKETDFPAEEWAWDHNYQGNNLGYRDSDHSLEKPTGTYRVAVVGDSVAAGAGVGSYADTFPHLLGQELVGSGLQAEILNFGVKGYSTPQEVETLREKALPFDPDLALLQWCVNDFRGPPDLVLGRLMEPERSAPSKSARLANRWLARSAIWRFFYFRVGPGPRTPEEGKQILDRIMASPENVSLGFSRLAELSAERGLPVLVVAFEPRGQEWVKDYEKAHAQVIELSERHGFSFLDLAPAFAECREGGEELMLDGLHPNPKGHRCAAQAISAKVLTMNPKVNP